MIFRPLIGFPTLELAAMAQKPELRTCVLLRCDGPRPVSLCPSSASNAGLLTKIQN